MDGWEGVWEGVVYKRVGVVNNEQCVYSEQCVYNEQCICSGQCICNQQNKGLSYNAIIYTAKYIRVSTQYTIYSIHTVCIYMHNHTESTTQHSIQILVYYIHTRYYIYIRCICIYLLLLYQSPFLSLFLNKRPYGRGSRHIPVWK